jgi:hypothetical protein
MFRHILTAAGAVSIFACDTPPRARETATTYAGPADTAAQTLLGTQLQAGPLIPAVRDQLRRFARQPDERTEGNLTGYKYQLARLTAAMEADVQRIGGTNMDVISALADSVADDLGGGTGDVQNLGDDGKIDSAKLQDHTARVERLIGLYQAAVQQSRGRRNR